VTEASTEFGSAHVFLTGATGFVGQAVLERLLADHPGTTVSILVRGKGSATAEGRLQSLLKKPVFRPWRERVGEAEAARQVAERVRIVDGGLGRVPELPADLDIVIHSASAVSFDPPIDQAFDTNVGGAVNLYEALRATGADPHVVHVSTCYVGGIRKGFAPEARLEHTVDWRAEHSAARAARERVELLSREPDQLRVFMDAARAKHGKEGPQAVAKAAETARTEWVTSRLVDAGRTRAQSLGWTDVYTLTKAFSERAAEELWAADGHRLSVVRPAIIESAAAHPFPGWIDGFKVADPLIIAFGRGQLPEFPGLPDSVLDLIPVDHVVNAILAVAANPQPTPRYYQIASGASNPLPFHEMVDYVRSYFREFPLPAADGGTIAVPDWKFPGPHVVEREFAKQERRLERAERRFERSRPGVRSRKVLAFLTSKRSELETLRSFMDLYRAYVQTEIVFGDRNTRALHAALPAELKADRGFDITTIDWDHYLRKVHIPAITTLTRAFAGRGGAPSAKPHRKPLPQRSDVVAVFDLDGTVVDSNIVMQYVWVRTAGMRKAAWPGEAVSVLASLPRYLRAERRDRGEFIRTVLRRYAGMSRTRLEKAVSGDYKATMLRHTSPAAVARIAEHRAAGHRTVLVTGSIGTLVQPIAHLFDEVVASSMHEQDGVLTGYLASPPLVDEARAAWLKQYAEEHGLDLSASYGYGDSHADLVWLELLGHPVAVNPDTPLAREAQRRRWEIVRWKKRGAGAPRHDGIGVRPRQVTARPSEGS